MKQEMLRTISLIDLPATTLLQFREVASSTVRIDVGKFSRSSRLEIRLFGARSRHIGRSTLVLGSIWHR